MRFFTIIENFACSFRQLSFFGRGARTSHVAYSNGQNADPGAMSLKTRVYLENVGGASAARRLRLSGDTSA
jgi:hypothetical protein